MNNDLQLFIDKVKTKTGIAVTIYDENGSLIGGEELNSPAFDLPVEGVVSDEKAGRTLFAIYTKTKKYVAEINGSGEVEKNYALLISTLAENFFFKENELKKPEFYKGILLGEINYSQYRKYMHKFRIPETSCFAMIITFDKENAETVNDLLLSYGGEKSDFALPQDDNQCALIKFWDEDADYQSSVEYAEFLLQSIFEETGVHVSVYIGGTVESAYDLSSSYSQALAAVRMGKGLGIGDGVHSYKDYVLLTMLEDLPKYKLSEYLGILTDASAMEIFSDKEMTDTAEEFLNCNLNISETSRKLYLHRNTLMYRLDKIERATGLDIRKFSDAVTFRLITMLYRLVK